MVLRFDPINGSNLLTSAVNPDETVVYEWNPETNDLVWSERFDLVLTPIDAVSISCTERLIGR